MLIYHHDMSSGLRYYVSIWASFWVFLPQSNNFRDGFRFPGSTRRIFFVEIQHEIILAPMCLCQRKVWKSNAIFFISHVGLPEFNCSSPRGYSEEFPADCAITYHVSTQRQNIIDTTHTWQQCSVTISEDILTTKYGFIQSQIDFTAKHR